MKKLVLVAVLFAVGASSSGCIVPVIRPGYGHGHGRHHHGWDRDRDDGHRDHGGGRHHRGSGGRD
jgi:hypothetical protein